MTVIRSVDADVKGCHVEEMLQKHWGSTHTVKVYREPNRSLGINIVGGKVDLQSSEKSSDALLGIFVKNVVPNSPAGKTGKFKTGDRILEVSGIDLREASHEKAVQAIRNATNPVIFVIQSLIPWKFTENELNSSNNESSSPLPSPTPDVIQSSTKTERSKNEVEITRNENEDLHKQQNDLVELDVTPNVTQNGEKAVLKESNETDLSPVVAQVTPVCAPQLPSDGGGQSTPEAAPSGSSFVYDEVNERVSDESSEGSDEDEENDVRDLEGRTVSSKGCQIDRASAGNVKRTKEEITTDKEEEDDFGYTMSEY
ncbi:hypothetical protein JTB14_004777 [Gonioctena quinquepunctata]|nr:hypothetical protein JTB14_004777 [Gonioctena quinquepunctata]